MVYLPLLCWYRPLTVAGSRLYGWGFSILSVYGGGLLLAGTVCGALTGQIANLLLGRLKDKNIRGFL